MAARFRARGQQRKRFEWRVIKIPYSSLNISLLIMFLALAGVVIFHYRDKLPVGGSKLSAVIRTVLSNIGISGRAQPGDNGGEDESFMEQRFATLSYLSGQVKVQRASDMNWISAESKMKLETGDRVRTFGGARAEVLFDDGSILKIKADSLIIIGDLMENIKTKVRQSSVKLMVSSIEADIKKSVVKGSRFRLEMPSAVADMNRAQISVRVGPGQDSNIRVYSGQVAVDTGQEKVSVGDLSQVSIGAGREVSQVTRILPVPKVLAPGNLSKFIVNDQSTSSVLLKWKAVDKADAYHLQIDSDRRFEKPVVDQASIRSSSYAARELPPGVYYARVSARDMLGQESGFSEPAVFMVVLDKKSPAVNVGKFVSSKAAGGYDIYVEGSTEPMAKISLAGREMVVDEQGRFSASLRGIPLNQKNVLLVGKDQAGNETVVSLDVQGG